MDARRPTGDGWPRRSATSRSPAANGDNRSHGLTVKNSIFDGYEGKTHPDNDRIVSVWRTDDATIVNNHIRWNNTSENINALAVGGATDGEVQGNRVEGLLRKGVQFWDYDGGLIESNNVKRWAQTPGAGNGALEDHGIYTALSNNSYKEKRGHWPR